VGGIRASRTARVASIALAVSLAGVAGLGCDDDAAPDEVDAAAAYTAIVEWQAGEQASSVDDGEEAELPVIYVVAADGETIDVGVQAAVTESTVDVATVRFADEAGETFDADLDGQPVRDHGSMLLVAAMPEPAPRVTVDLIRYLAAEESEPFRVEIRVEDAGAGSAVVTSATPM
jgi:hypothetical protein